MSSVETLADAIEPRLVEESKRGDFGPITVISVKVDRRLGPDDEPYTHVQLKVSDPPEGADTWPSEDAFKLRSRVRELAVERDSAVAETTFVVDLYPEHDDDATTGEPEGLSPADTGA